MAGGVCPADRGSGVFSGHPVVCAGLPEAPCPRGVGAIADPLGGGVDKRAGPLRPTPQPPLPRGLGADGAAGHGAPHVTLVVSNEDVEQVLTLEDCFEVLESA